MVNFNTNKPNMFPKKARTILHAVITFLLSVVSIDKVSAGLHHPVSKLAKKPVRKVVDPVSKMAGLTSDTPAVVTADSTYNTIDGRYKAAVDRLSKQAATLETYLKENNYNTTYCFLVDMSVPSGKKRFFVYNLKTGTVEQSSLVSHGIGSNINGSDEVLQFSNTPSSLQTSLGKYKIGTSYYGNFGLAFRLYGLDKTNDRAYERAIVLHGHSSIPTEETYPIRISESFGCPSVAPSFLETLTGYIRDSQKPILMWIYN